MGDEYAIRSATTGFGQQFEIGYSILKEARPDEFKQTFTETPPYVNFSSSMRVIDSYKVDNGIGGMNETQYEYGEARFHIAGRGFQGFDRIVQTNLAANTSTTTEFFQEFPWSGMVKRSTTEDLDSSLILSKFEVHADGGGFYKVSPTISSYQVGNSYCFYPTDTTSTQYFHNRSSPTGGLTQGSETSVTTNKTTQNSYCQQDSSISVMNDSTVTYTTEVEQTYEYKSAISANLPKKTTITKNVDYKSGVLVVNSNHHRTNDEIETIKEITYSLNSHSNAKSNNWVVDTVTALGNLGAVSGTTSFEYDQYGNATKIISGTGATSRWSASTMESEGYFVETTHNSEWGMNTDVTTTLVEPMTGQALEVADQHGIKSITEVNFLGLPISRATFDSNDNQIGTTAHLIYDWGKLETIADGMPKVTVFTDTMGRKTRTDSETYSGSTVTTETTYDALGQVLTQTAPSANGGSMQTTTFSHYDVHGRPGIKDYDDGHVDYTSEYTYTGFITHITVDSPGFNMGLPMSRSYNSLKQLMRTKDALGNESNFLYNAAGLPVVLQDVALSQITATYDGLGRKKGFDDPNMGEWSFTYNQFGELATQIDANNDTTNFVYDDLGRLENRGGRAFIFDGPAGNGRLYQTNYDGKVETYAYDSLGRVDTVTTQIDGITFVHETAYDGYYGRVKAEKFPSGEVVGYNYNNRGFLTQEYRPFSDGNHHIFRHITSTTPLGSINTQTLWQWS